MRRLNITHAYRMDRSNEYLHKTRSNIAVRSNVAALSTQTKKQGRGRRMSDCFLYLHWLLSLILKENQLSILRPEILSETGGASSLLLYLQIITYIPLNLALSSLRSPCALPQPTCNSLKDNIFTLYLMVRRLH